jgi:hypothetical protein
MAEEPMKVPAMGGGPKWTALVRKSDGQIMLAVVGHGNPAYAVLAIFLRDKSVPSAELAVVALDADLKVTDATDVGMAFNAFTATNMSAEDLARLAGRGKA